MEAGVLAGLQPRRRPEMMTQSEIRGHSVTQSEVRGNRGISLLYILVGTH